MPFQRKISRILIYFGLCISLFASNMAFPSMAAADLSLIKKSITYYNIQKLKGSLSDGSYRGEEGVLRIRPEIARSLGLKVPADPDYLEAKDLFEKADNYRKKALEAISTQAREKSKGEHARRAGEMALLSNQALQSAQKLLKSYRSRLNPGMDERLDRDRCNDLMEELLYNCLEEASYNLRDALGLFYNRCQGVGEGDASLTPQNIGFVNHVFREFTEKAPWEMLKGFDLDRYERSRGANPGYAWKNIIKGPGSRYTSLVESILEKQKKARYHVDPLLFMALIRRESNFNPQAVSYMGAAGLSQIMPKTARGLGMKNIFEPSYFDLAVSLTVKERQLGGKAISLISKITEENKAGFAGLARRYMQSSLDYGKRRAQLFSRYKRELLEKSADDRLKPARAIEYGYKYFSEMMRIQKGDMSLALASYNAGPHRVKEYKGIPPYAETVSFRNSVLGYYRDYLHRLKEDQERGR